MKHSTEPGIVAIMGSGETSPTMVSVHQNLVRALPSRPSNAVLLETPYGFQENVADISARAQDYFRRRVGLPVTVAPGMRGQPYDRPARPDEHPGRAAAATIDHGLAMLRSADWIFSGPGSPTYALACWRNGPVEQALRDRLTCPRGVVVFASAAAATMGRYAVPVYEIYKVGTTPYWLDGLDLLGCLGLKVAVVPHYDNAEGGTHDTRYSYLGERRLARLEHQMPADAAVLGVDEHTAVVFDLVAATVEVVGRGSLTVRRAGHSVVLPAGTTTTLIELRTLVRQGRTAGIPTAPLRTPGQGNAHSTPPSTLAEVTIDCERRFEDARQRRNAVALTQAVLDLETVIRSWAADTDEDDGVDKARSVLRSLIVRLGEAAGQGLRDPDERLRPLVEPLIELRDQLRRQRSYAAADTIRDALVAGGLRLSDTGAGTSWSMVPAGDG
ncbi:hypothetical protein GCM10027280_35770 [Micromonospora polyrhachis]|uniref:Cysteinyl-tRNA synthetase n=1 Tax=Micromonospora polyrhachis TaxID=1282883 RepID=A0A7W7WPD5_9ACTN|nr:hypothetical protein [Micromonospora polyrhachis]MBB4958820.1 hypothetical protein [Micromonospora polyrhachis]